ncbi:MAG: ketoacyl-ACP synthase III [Flavobacterium sp.]|jgi:3-oxoacyl-[acyl-carrier-protein] synthase III|nr:ketoacyl-ACP synthase III [Flavobacterium sp.]|tara:strand:- start:1642 stop:2700 length:1059 start_codon:yes stop_codon:yes gene_type:complete
MPKITYNNIGITAISAAIPKNTIKNLEYTNHFDENVVKEIVDKTGIKERRFAPDHLTSSDLCYHAAEKLILDNAIDKTEIDVLIFVSQTPDYRMPATSIILQDRLGLSKDTAAFDVSLGCSGFVYGLTMAYNYANLSGIKKVLLLDGETRSRIYHPKDRKTAFLFGDGGIACLIEKKDSFLPSFFSLNSDGSKQNLIKVDAGGYRNPSSINTMKEKVVDIHGNVRTDEHGYMNGGDVFNFLLREIPKDIKQVLDFSDTNINDIDYFLFHQANKFMNDYLSKKMKLDKDKVPQSISKYGNTSSVSIPLTIVDQLKGLLKKKNLLLCGFGVGMSWASAVINVEECKVSDIIEVE